MNQTQRKYIIDRINELVNDKKCQLLNEARQKLDVPFEKEVAEINQRIEKLKNKFKAKYNNRLGFYTSNFFPVVIRQSGDIFYGRYLETLNPELNRKVDALTRTFTDRIMLGDDVVGILESFIKNLQEIK